MTLRNKYKIIIRIRRWGNCGTERLRNLTWVLQHKMVKSGFTPKPPNPKALQIPVTWAGIHPAWLKKKKKVSHGLGQKLVQCHPASQFGAMGCRAQAPTNGSPDPYPKPFFYPFCMRGRCWLAWEEVAQKIHPRSRILPLTWECPAFWSLTLSSFTLNKQINKCLQLKPHGKHMTLQKAKLLINKAEISLAHCFVISVCRLPVWGNQFGVCCLPELYLSLHVKQTLSKPNNQKIPPHLYPAH